MEAGSQFTGDHATNLRLGHIPQIILRREEIAHTRHEHVLLAGTTQCHPEPVMRTQLLVESDVPWRLKLT